MRSLRRKIKRRKLSEAEKLYREIYKAYRKEVKPWERKYIGETKQEEEFRIKQLVKEIQYAKEVGAEIIDPRKAFRQEVNVLSRHTGEGTLRDLFRELKSQRHDAYNHLNTYLYRLGYSVATYFNNPDNSDLKTIGTITYMTLNLPYKSSGISYGAFYIEYERSGGIMQVAEFV